MTPWRRLLTIPGYFAAWCLWLAAIPIWLPLSIAVDLLRGVSGVALRSACLVAVYLTCEVIGIAISGGLWAWNAIRPIDPDRWTDLHFRLEAWWATTLLRSVVWLYGLRLEVEDADDAELARGPYILLLRHASSGDTLLASAVISSPYGMRLRYVLKQEHLWDPCLDIVGHRVPNIFVDRESDDPSQEVRRVMTLGRDLGPKDGVLIYPEGTRFSPTKRARVLDRLRESGDSKMLDYASGLTSVLPPRPGGTLGVLEAAPEADVVVCSHTGFEGAASLADIWKGALIHQRIRIQFRRIPRSQIPSDPASQKTWLLEQWQRVDAWVCSHGDARPSNQSAGPGA
jgi:1-acyl-sn-glycerol-3-phosphate acyltransferase